MAVKAKHYRVPLAVALVSFASSAWIESLPAERARALASETGPFEVASTVFYGMAALLAGFHLARQMTIPRLAACVMLLWGCLRELDFQKRFTYRSIESIGYYTRPDASWSEKALVLLILSPFVMAGCYLLWLLIRSLRPALACGERWTAYFVAGLVLGATSGVLEKVLHWGAAEEVCETGLALLVLLLVWELRPRPTGLTPAPN